MLFNVNCDRTQFPNGIDWLDVFPDWKESALPQTEEEMLATMMLFAKSTEGLSH